MSAHGPVMETKYALLILSATFLFGFLSGILIFFEVHTADDVPKPDTQTKGYSVSVYSYGGCERSGACPSYQLKQNGTYTYLVRLRGGGEKRYEDALTSKQRETVTTQMKSTDFASLMQTANTEECPTARDGIAYRYQIEYEGKRYPLDSCKHSLATVPLFETLNDYFVVFNTLYAD